MKRFSLYITLLCIVFGTSMSISFAAISSTAPIVGTATGENAGILTFNYEVGLPGPNEVSINGNTLTFTGNFWSANAGWCTFSGLGTNGAQLTGVVNIMPMTGYAWCENAGWVSFNPKNNIDSTTFTNSDAFFDKVNGLFHGYAWSENLGWINMEGLMTDITPPSLTNFKPFAANTSKVFTMIDLSPVVPSGGNYTFKVGNWNGGNTIYSPASPNFTHDFRQAKSYALSITDPFGNSTSGNVQVVADVPADIITSPIAGFTAGGTASSYTGTFANSVVADATAVHTMNINLRDQYGNPVINEPGVKTVNVRVVFNNNVDKDQRDIILGGNLDLGDAIQFPSNTFAGLTYLSGSVGIASNTSGNYSLNISSYAPSKTGYLFTTTNNDISLQKLSYEVIANVGNIGVGEVTETDIKNKIGTNNLRFSPALSVGSVSNTDNWNIIQGYNTNFTATLLTGTTVSLTNPQVQHILDIDNNILMSYQNPAIISGGTETCNGYMKTITTFNGAYTSTNPACNRPDSSNLLMTSAPFASNMTFSWKPTIIYAAPANSVVKYTSEISYTNGLANVVYPSYNRTNNSALAANGAVMPPNPTNIGSGVINQSVKILGMSNGRNTIDVLAGNNTNAVGSLTRVDIKNAIHKNVEIMTRGGVPASARYVIYNNNTISDSNWPTNKDTLIIQGRDLIIDGNITNTTANIHGIIVLQDTAGNGGNIYIKKNVSNIAAVLFADKSIISGELPTPPTPLKYYSDALPSAQTATGQLFLEGSIISDNTIGGASMTPLKCPYGANICTSHEARRYDLNYFRFYSGTGTSSPGASLNPAVPVGSETYPFVIKYDTRLQTAPPPGFNMP